MRARSLLLRGVMAVPTGFEPAFSALTGPRVWPGYTTGPTAAKSTSGRKRAKPGKRHCRVGSGEPEPHTYNSIA
jgi:hypothetical protein